MEIELLLRKIESDNNIIILFATEAGSRAWGLNSDDSDYDIRFVYKKKDLLDYISVASTNECIVGSMEEFNYEWHGWDIIKALKLIKESNPNIVEWLYSPIVYIDRQNFKHECLEILNRIHTRISLLYHYKNMAFSNWETHILYNDFVKTKKYSYVIRPIATLQYLLNRKSENVEIIVNFNELINVLLNENLDKITYDELIRYVDNRKTSKTNIGPRIEKIDKWIEEQFNRFDREIRNDIKDNTPREESSFHEQSFISTHKKLENEVKKIKLIVGKNNVINRTEYLNAIGFCLQLLWLTKNPTKVRFPRRIRQLLQETYDELSENIRTEIDKIIDTDEKQITEEGLKYIDFVEKQIEETCEYFNIDRTNVKINRNDLIEYYLINLLNIIWLIDNPDEKVKDIPKSIFSNDKTPENIRNNIKNILELCKTKSCLIRNEIIDEWLDQIVDKYRPIVENQHKKLIEVKEINTQRRYENSLKKVTNEDFDSIIKKILQ